MFTPFFARKIIILFFLKAKQKDAELRAAREIEFLTNLKKKVDRKLKK
jgi:hypothetical protein